MKICFFNRSYWPDQTATGQLLTELAEDLVAVYGFEVTVVAGRPLHAADTTEGADGRRGLVTVETRNGVRIFRAHGTARNPARFAGRAINYVTYFFCACVAALRVRADVVVSLTDPPIIGLAAWLAAWRSRARFVFLCEDVFPEVARLLDDFRSPLVERVLDRVNRWMLRRADAIVALGPRMRARLIDEKGARADRLTVIHNWVDTQAIVPLPKETPFAQEHELTGRFVVMHAGNVGRSQALDGLLDAAALLRESPDIVFVIVGAGTSRASLGERAAREGLTNVRFLPYQPKAQLAEIFGAADVMIVSLVAGIEGYIVPSKVYSILAAGRPYIAALDASAEPALIAQEHDCGIVVPPRDAEALASAIRALAADPERVSAMGRRAREASRQFDRTLAVRAYADLFEAVL
jgi:glycosyltransferase involved in cell wall biosynthesis